MKIGTLGTSEICHQFIEATKKVSGVEVTACCSREIKKAHHLSSKYNIKYVFDDFEKMCISNQIDVVYIACPNHLHFDYAIKSLNHKLNVIIEKPFAVNEKQATILMDLAKKNKCFIFEAIPILYTDEFNYFKNIVREMTNIGMVQGSYCQKSRKYDEVLSGILPSSFDIKQAGGALMDLNIYQIHAVVSMFGKPIESFYYANFLGCNSVDLNGMAVLKYPEFHCYLSAAKNLSAENYFQVQSTEGTVIIDGGINFGKKIKSSNDLFEIPYINQKERLIPEIKKYQEIIQNDDYDVCYDILEHTKIVLGVCDDLRRSANIVFDVD